MCVLVLGVAGGVGVGGEEGVDEWEEAGCLSLGGADNPGPAIFRLEGVDRLPRERFVALIYDSLVGLVLDHLVGRLDLPTQPSASSADASPHLDRGFGRCCLLDRKSV